MTETYLEVRLSHCFWAADSWQSVYHTIPYHTNTLPYLISTMKQRWLPRPQPSSVNEFAGRVKADQALLAHESTPTIVSWATRWLRGEKTGVSAISGVMRLACAILLLVGARAAGVAPAETLSSAVPAEKKNPIDAVDYVRVAANELEAQAENVDAPAEKSNAKPTKEAGPKQSTNEAASALLRARPLRDDRGPGPLQRLEKNKLNHESDRPRELHGQLGAFACSTAGDNALPSQKLSASILGADFVPRA